jgi:PTH1 family peptidyl-tRNA hydrolase
VKIILAQGNYDPEYNNTRHNVGFMALDTLADSLKASWSQKSRFSALIAEVVIEGEKTLLVKPTTFYNETGSAARKIIDFYKLESNNDLLVIHDDISLPFGTIRVRKQGSDAGNNGIKSLNSHLNPEYSRIRIGTDNDLRAKMGDSDFVLSKFSKDESEKIEKSIMPQTIKLIEQFCNNNLESTSHKI